MSCPTCGHTFQCVSSQPDYGHAVWHCPRCGTLQIDRCSDEPDVYVPALVDRCRQFSRVLGDAGASGRRAWNRLGIQETIQAPNTEDA